MIKKPTVSAVGLTKKIAAVLAAIIMLSAFPLTFGNAAVSYEGSGKQADPYLVKTADQLAGMINNPTAFYKLANTIDLSSQSNFKPIGTLANKFKGTFTCDTKSDGTPKYIIKNFKQTVSPKGATFKEKYSGYKKGGKSGWECGLFGATEGATFTNIVVLDANIKSNVQGSYQMNSDYTTNPGMDEQAAGILVSIAKNTTFTGCGVSGKVTSASNHVGGMVGNGGNCTINRCYSYATVKSTGKWGTGGLAGSGSGKITESFYDGDFTGGETHAGAFAGAYRGDNVSISDCWSAGTVAKNTSGCFLGTKVHEDTSKKEVIEVCKNVYTMSRIKGSKAKATVKVPFAKSQKCFNVKLGGVLEKQFYPVTKAELNKEFKSLANWSVGSGYPQLKNVKPVSNASKYKVEKTAAGGGTTNTSGSTNTASGSANTQSGSTNTASGSESAVDGNNNTAQVSGGAKTITNDSLRNMSTAELILIILLIVLILLTVTGSAITIVLIIKRTRSASGMNYYTDEYLNEYTELDDNADEQDEE